MYCQNCGNHLNSYDSFCPRCGKARSAHRNPNNTTVSPWSQSSYANPQQQQYQRFVQQSQQPRQQMPINQPVRRDVLLLMSIVMLFLIWPVSIYGFVKYANIGSMPYNMAYPECERVIGVMKNWFIAIFVLFGIYFLLMLL